MRRLLICGLSIAMVAAGAGAADAKPRAKSPRLHAFRSCTNLLGYAQRNGLRVVRESAVLRPVAPPPEALAPDQGAAGGGDGRSAPVAAPAPAAGDGTSQTNVQEAGIDEPDWVKASGTTLFITQE